jgi:acyl-CoA synthetase (AMP-forming)/AMP-acid ligase II
MNQATGKMPFNLGDLLLRAGMGERTAFVDLRLEGKPVEITASDFDQHIHAFARGLKKLGIQPGQSVGLLSENRWEMLVAYLGTMFMGAVAVPINHRLPRETVGHIIKDADIRLMFFDEGRRSFISGDVRNIGIDDSGADGFQAFLNPGSIDAYVPDDNDIAEILYTSGSTGMPKGVPLTHTGQLWALNHYLEPLDGARTGRNTIIAAPLYHMNGLIFSCACLLNATIIISLPKFDAARYIQAVADYRCAELSGVPTMFAMIAALADRPSPAELRCVKKITIGSAPLSDALLNQMSTMFPAAKISNGYGSTEAGPAIFGPHPDGKPQPWLSVGYPLKEIQWRLRGGTSPDVGAFELKTGALPKGYLNRPDADRERFENGWFKSNDIMRRDEDGFFYFVSRADDMFVCGGENIYPEEVEALLNRHPSVQQSLVVSAPDDIKGLVPVAFVVPMPREKASEQVIKTFCLEKGAAYSHPRRVVFKDALPVGGTHKIDRRSLEREALELMVAAGRASPSQ